MMAGMQCPACGYLFEIFTPTQDPQHRIRIGAPVICEQCLSLSVLHETQYGQTMRHPNAAEQARYGTHLRRAIQYWITRERD